MSLGGAPSWRQGQQGAGPGMLHTGPAPDGSVAAAAAMVTRRRTGDTHLPALPRPA